MCGKWSEIWPLGYKKMMEHLRVWNLISLRANLSLSLVHIQLVHIQKLKREFL